MNLIIIRNPSIEPQSLIKLSDVQHNHVKNILNASAGKTVQVGQLNGKIGVAEVVQTDANSTTIKVMELQQPPPKALNVKIILAATRPKMMKRIFRNLAMLGVKKIHLIHTYNVEKSYWDSPLYSNENFNEYFIQGLEQAKDTILPTLTMYKRFKPFVEDISPGLKSETNIIFHPYTDTSYTHATNDKSLTIAIGPERGFTDYEVQKFNQVGFATNKFGDRPLRAETFVTAVLGSMSLHI